MILNEPSIDSKDVQFEKVFNKGYSITETFYLDDNNVLIRDEFEFTGNYDTNSLGHDATISTDGYTKYSEIGYSYVMNSPIIT
jgi:hypothetical protein